LIIALFADALIIPEEFFLFIKPDVENEKVEPGF